VTLLLGCIYEVFAGPAKPIDRPSP